MSKKDVTAHSSNRSESQTTLNLCAPLCPLWFNHHPHRRTKAINITRRQRSESHTTLNLCAPLCPLWFNHHPHRRTKAINISRSERSKSQSTLNLCAPLSPLWFNHHPAYQKRKGKGTRPFPFPPRHSPKRMLRQELLARATHPCEREQASFLTFPSFDSCRVNAADRSHHAANRLRNTYAASPVPMVKESATKTRDLSVQSVFLRVI